MLKKIRGFFGRISAPLLLLLVAAVIFDALFLTRLGGLLPTQSEQAQNIGVATKSQVIEESIFLPQKVLQLTANHFWQGNVTLLRLVSVLVVAVTILAFYRVLQKWHTTRVAILATLLFAGSTYVLHEGRTAAQGVGYLSVFPILLLIGTWLKSKRYVYRLPLASFLVALLLYVPGVWVFVLASAVFFQKRIRLAWKFVDTRHRLLSVGIFAIAMLPLLYTWVRRPGQSLQWLGVGENLTLGDVLTNLISIPKALLYSGINDPSVWVVGTPILDVFTLAMLILGIAGYVNGHHPLRARLLIGYALLSVLQICAGEVSIGVIIPLIYIVAANGIARMLQSWFVVFPKNPVARNVGVFLIAIAVVFVVRYHTIRYFDAWPSIDATKNSLSMVQYKQ